MAFNAERLFHVLIDVNAVVAGGEIGVGLATKTPLMVVTGLSFGLTGAASVYLKNSFERKNREDRQELQKRKDLQ
jgi:hypothetical protein